MNSAYIASVINSTLRSTTPILLAALGCAMCSQVGVFNVALEAQMLIACFTSIAVDYYTSSVLLSVLAGVLSGAVVGAVVAVLQVKYKAADMVVGTALNLLVGAITTFLLYLLFGLRGMAAYTYATSAVNGCPSLNYEAEVTQVGLVNYFTYDNLDAFYSEMQSLLSQMRSDGAEATMLYIHWGTEYSLQADSSQRMIAQKMCDMGVDVIVGGHPHVVEPMELLTSSSDSRHKTAVIFSLGNAVSNQRRDLMTLNTGHTEDGALFTVTFEKYADGGVYVADVNVMPTWVNLHSVDEKQEYNIVPLEDARRTEWQNLYGLDAAALANAVASYDRTMNIVGPGLEQCRSYYAQEKQARETPVVPTEEAA